MKTLILRAPGVVDNPQNFKRLGDSSFLYTAALENLDPNHPIIMGFQSGQGIRSVTIEGATLYKVVGGAIDFANPADGTLSWDGNVDGSLTNFAFTPTINRGYIRITNQGNAIYNFTGVYAFNDAVQIHIEPRELKNIRNFVWDLSVPAGYLPGFTLSGDVNGFSESKELVSFAIAQNIKLNSNFSVKYWGKLLAPTVTNFNLYATAFNADVDLKIFNATNIFECRLANNVAMRFYGSIDYLLATAKQLFLWENLDHNGVTGSLGSLSTTFEQILINVPNLTGGYTSRNWPGAFINLKINAPKVPAGDWDLLLSDLATKAPALAGGVVQVNKRTAASDAHVATLTNKGISVIVGF